MQTLMQHILAILNANNIPYAVTGPVWFICKKEFAEFYQNVPVTDAHNLGLCVLVSPANFDQASDKLKQVSSTLPGAVMPTNKTLPGESGDHSTVQLMFKQTGGIAVRKSVNFFGIYFDAKCDSFYKTDVDQNTGVTLLKPLDHLVWMLTEYHYGVFPVNMYDKIKVLIDMVLSNPDDCATFKEYVDSPLCMLFTRNLGLYRGQLKKHGIEI